MTRLAILLCAAALFLSLLTPPPALAQDIAPQAETLPIEVALLYHKLLKQDPPYEQLIYSNQSLVKSADGFGQTALIGQQRSALQKMYEGLGDKTLIHSSYRMHMKGVVSDQRRLDLSGIDADIPLIYPLNDSNRYGVFIRNAREVTQLTPPYAFDNFPDLAFRFNTGKVVLPVELTLKPVAADTKDFALGNGGRVHVILADVVQINVEDEQGKRVLLQKRFKDWQPDVSDVNQLYQPDMLPATQ